jgi:hypothetical protein
MTLQSDDYLQSVNEDASHPQADSPQSEAYDYAKATASADAFVQLTDWCTPSKTAPDNATKLVLSIPRRLGALTGQARSGRGNMILSDAKSSVEQWCKEVIELIHASQEAAELVAALREVSRRVEEVPLDICRDIRSLGEFSDPLVLALFLEQVSVAFRLRVLADALVEEERDQVPDPTDEEHIPFLFMDTSLPVTELMADSVFVAASLGRLCCEVGEDAINESRCENCDAFWSTFHEGWMELHCLAFPGAHQSALEIVREATKCLELQLLITDVNIEVLKTGSPLTRIFLTIPWFFDGQKTDWYFDPGDMRLMGPTLCLAPMLKQMTKVDDIHLFSPDEEVSYTKVIGETEGGPVHLYLTNRTLDTVI